MKRAIASLAAFALAACSGGGLPSGPVVNSPGGPTQSPPPLVRVKVTVTIPAGGKSRVMNPNYVSVNTQSVVIQLASVNGQGVSGVNPTTINTLPRSHGCKSGSGGTVCTATAQGSPGDDVFAVTTYDGLNSTGDLLSVGTVQAKVSSGGGGVQINNTLSLALGGVIASLALTLSPNSAKRGKPATSAVTLNAYDASGAQIVGPSDFYLPITLQIQGDTVGAFKLHASGRSAQSLTIAKPTSGIELGYDGNAQANPVTVAASVNGPSGIGKSRSFALKGKQPPPPVGTIYALNLGASYGIGATVTEYSGKEKGNAAPERTLQLSTKLYARSIAVDANGNLFVGYFNGQFGVNPSGGPDNGNEVAIYAPNASGNDQPTAIITADKTTKTAIYPGYMAFDPAGDLVTYGATAVDGNGGSDAVLTYAPGSQGPAAPLHGWAFYSPLLIYPGPTGLALDSSGNFYVNGALHSSLGPSYGTFITLAADIGDPAVEPSRTIPWNYSQTQLPPLFTTNVGLDSANEIFDAYSYVTGSGSKETCQGRVSVFAAGTGSSVSNTPLRTASFQPVLTNNPSCGIPNNPLVPYYPSITLFGPTIFVADDFNNTITEYSASAHGNVKSSLQIAGSATGLSAPIALVITSISGRAKAHPVHPLRALQTEQ